MLHVETGFAVVLTGGGFSINMCWSQSSNGLRYYDKNIPLSQNCCWLAQKHMAMAGDVVSPGGRPAPQLPVEPKSLLWNEQPTFSAFCPEFCAFTIAHLHARQDSLRGLCCAHGPVSSTRRRHAVSSPHICPASERMGLLPERGPDAWGSCQAEAGHGACILVHES